MNYPLRSRRNFLVRSTSVAIGSVIVSQSSNGLAASNESKGAVIGQAAGERVGQQVLADGGNAIDAIVAAALAAAVAAPSSTGIGGYGMSAVLAVDSGRRIVAIDGNSTAPVATPVDLLIPDSNGRLPDGFDKSNSYSSVGWLSAGVPGILAGLQITLDQFGTKCFAELVQPAIGIARDGFPWPKNLVHAIRNNKMIQADAGSRKLYCPGGAPIAEGQRFMNPDLAAMLADLAKSNSVEAFYRGDIAQRIADGFKKNEGLVTAKDMANYQARVVEPISIDWGPNKIHTAPLTAGGLSILQMLLAIQALEWSRLPPGLARNHAKIEAMRLAWRDRLTLLGDPDFVNVPISRLLSKEYAMESADRIKAVITSGKFLSHNVSSRPQTGTIHLNAADKDGNFAALTLTHGNGFGACVTVDGLGLTLGHGMSRFDPNPGHPNAPSPNKRPLHNMVPTIVTRDGLAILAVGGTGGRKIPSALFEVLTQYIALDQPISKSIAAPRIHTEGTETVSFEKSWPKKESEAIKKIGYKVITEGSANVNGVAVESGTLVSGAR